MAGAALGFLSKLISFEVERSSKGLEKHFSYVAKFWLWRRRMKQTD